MAEDQIRIGVIGTSWWTDAMFLPSFASHPNAMVAAICGRTRARADEMAAKYGIGRVFTDYRRLIDSSELDAVVVATPDDLHYEMTMMALDAGLHVLCEKPLALNAGHAKEMFEKAEARQLKHMTLFAWRWQPHFLFVKSLMDDGYIGRCFHARFSFLGGFGRGKDYRWRADGKRSNGIVSDLGAHMIDFARWYLGDIDKVCAQLCTFVEVASVDDAPVVPTNDAAILLLQMANGAPVTIEVSAVAERGDHGAGIEARFYGELGTLEADQIIYGPQAGGYVRGITDKDENLRTLEIPMQFSEGLDLSNPFAPFYKQAVGPRLFVDSIIDDKQVTPNFYDGWKVQEVIEAALKSQNERSWVTVG
jgi:predicted dehydrogenase